MGPSLQTAHQGHFLPIVFAGYVHPKHLFLKIKALPVNSSGKDRSRNKHPGHLMQYASQEGVSDQKCS